MMPSLYHVIILCEHPSLLWSRLLFTLYIISCMEILPATISVLMKGFYFSNSSILPAFLVVHRDDNGCLHCCYRAQAVVFQSFCPHKVLTCFSWQVQLGSEVESDDDRLPEQSIEQRTKAIPQGTDQEPSFLHTILSPLPPRSLNAILGCSFI